MAAELVREALVEANRNNYLRVLYFAMVAMNFFYLDRRLVSAILVLLAYVLCLVMYLWLIRSAIQRRLPEALARHPTGPA